MIAKKCLNPVFFLTRFTSSSLKFANIDEAYSYAKTNKESLTPNDIFKIFCGFFSAEHYSKLRYSKPVLGVIKIAREKRYLNALSSEELIRVAKYYSRLRLEAGIEWDELLNKLEEKLSVFNDDQIHNLLFDLHEIMREMPKRLFWEKFLGEVVDRIVGYPSEVIMELFEDMSDLNILNSELWVHLEYEILVPEKSKGLNVSDLFHIMEIYKRINRNSKEFLKQLQFLSLSKYLQLR